MSCTTEKHQFNLGRLLSTTTINSPSVRNYTHLEFSNTRTHFYNVVVKIPTTSRQKKLTGGSKWTIKRYFILMNVQMLDTLFSDNGAAAECCVFSRQHDESHRWWGGTCGPCPNHGSSCRLTWGHAFPCACARPLWSIVCRGCVWWPCGRCRPGSPRRICKWSLRPPSRSSAHGDRRSDGQHAPEEEEK